MEKKIIQIIAIILLIGMILTLVPVFVSATNSDQTENSVPSEPSTPSEPSQPSEPSAPPTDATGGTTVPAQDDLPSSAGAIAEPNSGVVIVYAPEMDDYMRSLTFTVPETDSTVEDTAGKYLSKKYSDFVLAKVYDVRLANPDGTPAALEQAVGLDLPLVADTYLEDPHIFYIDTEAGTATDLGATMNDDMISMHVASDRMGYFALVGGLRTGKPFDSNSLWWIAPVVILALTAAGIGIYFLAGKKKTAQKKPNKKKKK